MNIKRSTSFRKIMFLIILIGSVLFPFGVDHLPVVHAQDFVLPKLEPYLSADGLTLYNGGAPLIVVLDPNPARQGIQVPTAPEVEAAIADPDATNAAFSFTFVAAGGTDPWGAVCQTFPEQAKTAFSAAAAIWTSTIQSSVPITISACWSDIGSSSVLGYSGVAMSYRNFTGAPKPNTWYDSSLANALAGSDLDATEYDDYITYNSVFTWYYGTDGHPTAGTVDLVSVAAHEIAHGLDFSGSAAYSGGTGSYGYGTGSPNIYDTFMEDSSGTKLTTYANPSVALGSLLTSGSLWFNGTNANAGNNGSRVKIYAPSSWDPGSSYSHLDYNTFAGTINSMMVYAIGSGSANHNPGPATTGLLQDLGWALVTAGPPAAFTKTSPVNTTSQLPNLTLRWAASSGATSYEYCIDTSSNNTCDTSWVSTGTNTSVSLTGLALGNHSWQVRAVNTYGNTEADGGAWWSFMVVQSKKVYLPLVLKPLPLPGAFNKTTPSNGATGQSTSPTLSWGTSSNATGYEYCYDTSNNSTCDSGIWNSIGTSTSVPLSGLALSTSYYWQVRANSAGGTTYADGGAWWSFTTTGSTSGPTAGFWKSSNGATEFYVTPAQTSVKNFAIYISVTGCGSYKITRTTEVPIVSNQFSFSGTFYASGTFDSTTSAHGTLGLSSFYISGCGSVSGGPYSWTATWQNSSQPTIVALSVIPVSESQKTYYYYTINTIP
jgi:hypothetical protein